MAMLIREEHRLPTIRLRLGNSLVDTSQSSSNETGTGVARTQAVVLSQIVQGTQAESPWVRTDAAALGLQNDDWDPGSPDPELAATPIGGQVAALMQVSEPSRPLWYHIAQNSARLSLLPWERMFRAVAPVPFLRIPNFMNMPYRCIAKPSIVICASAPIGDCPYALPQFVSATLDAIEVASDQAGISPVVHLFTDQEAMPHLAPRIGNLHGLKVRLHPFASSDNSESPTAQRGEWLNWIGGSLEGTSANIIHFIGPGFLQGDRGGIVLASRPDRNERKGLFLGAAELVTFFDRVGCSAMVFSNPDMPQWVAGQRALVFELSWLRAGPIVLTDTPALASGALSAAYRMLFGQGGSSLFAQLEAAAPLHLCCHPSLADPANATVIGPEEEVDPTVAFVRNHEAILSATRKLSMTEQIEQRGTRAAMDFLSSLIEARGGPS
jgi:hypothetical protein